LITFHLIPFRPIPCTIFLSIVFYFILFLFISFHCFSLLFFAFLCYSLLLFMILRCSLWWFIFLIFLICLVCLIYLIFLISSYYIDDCHHQIPVHHDHNKSSWSLEFQHWTNWSKAKQIKSYQIISNESKTKQSKIK
jgi:hypothetical protein